MSSLEAESKFHIQKKNFKLNALQSASDCFVSMCPSGPSSKYILYIPVREDPGLVGLCDDDDSCLKNSLGFMERWDTNAAASCRSSNVQRAQENEMIKQTQLVEFLEQAEMKIQHSSDTCGPFSFVTKF